MLLVQEVEAIFVVNFEIWNVEVILNVFILAHGQISFLEEEAEGPRNDSPALPAVTATHGEGLARASLAIGENGAIIAFDTVLNNWLRHLLEYLYLLWWLIKHLGKVEAMILLQIISYIPKVLILRYLQTQHIVNKINIVVYHGFLRVFLRLKPSKGLDLCFHHF